MFSTLTIRRNISWFSFVITGIKRKTYKLIFCSIDVITVSLTKCLNVSVFVCIYKLFRTNFTMHWQFEMDPMFSCLCLIWKVCVCKISGGLTMVDWHEWVTETESRSEKVPCGWNPALQLWWHHLVTPVPSVWKRLAFILFLLPSLYFPPAPFFHLFPGLSICFVQ